MVQQKDPIWKHPLKTPSQPSHGAAFIFIHGFDDDAQGIEDIPNQIRASSRLPHLHYILPNAPLNHLAMATAWYAPIGLSPIPPSRPELAEDEDEDGLLRSQTYFETLISDLHDTHAIPLSRIVIGGFSQGCAQALLLALTSGKYAGKLGGVVGLMGYLPLGAKRVGEMRVAEGLGEEVGVLPMVLARGREDRVVPGWVWRRTLGDLEALGVRGEGVRVGEYEGLGHSVNGVVIGQMVEFLESVVPDLDGESG